MTQVFRCRVPQRTILSPEFPAPVVSRMTCMLRMISAYTVALAKAFDGEVVADMQNIQIYGLYGQDFEGNLFLMREIFWCGFGRTAVCGWHRRRGLGPLLQKPAGGIH